MSTAMSPTTGVTWVLCGWSRGCGMPVSTDLFRAGQLCRWHARCANCEDQAWNREAFDAFLAWMQSAYPSTGWWGWPADRLWPVLQGLHTIWDAEERAA